MSGHCISVLVFGIFHRLKLIDEIMKWSFTRLLMVWIIVCLSYILFLFLSSFLPLVGALSILLVLHFNYSDHFNFPVLEPPDETPNSKLHFFIEQRRVIHFAWLSRTDTYHGGLNFESTA